MRDHRRRDTWPLRHGLFDLCNSGKEVLHGDLGTRRGMTAMPLSYIGMRVKTWIEVVSMGCKRHLPRSPAEVIIIIFYTQNILKYYSEYLALRLHM